MQLAAQWLPVVKARGLLAQKDLAQELIAHFDCGHADANKKNAELPLNNLVVGFQCRD